MIRALPRRALFSNISKYKNIICNYSDDVNVIKSFSADVEIPNATVTEFIFDRFKYPHKIAIECAITGRKYTFEELRRKSINLGHNLRTVLKLSQNDVVAVLLPNTPEFAISILGVMHGSLIVTTLNSENKSEEIRRQLLDCKAKTVITTCGLFKLVAASTPSPHNTHILTVKSEVFDKTPVGSINFHEFTESKINVVLKSNSSNTDAALLPYSSGTTGIPKGLIHTHYSIVGNICQLNTPDAKVHETTTETHQDVVPAVVQLTHMYGFVTLLLNSLYNMSKVVTLPKFQPETFLNVLNQPQPTVLFAVPPIVMFLMNHHLVKLSHFKYLRTIETSAAPLNVNVEEFLSKVGKPLNFFIGYGTSETGLITLNKDHMKNPKSIGKPLANSYLKVSPVDDLNKNLPSYSKGHLLTKTPGVMKGYYNSPESLENAFTTDGWLKTGDLAYYDDNRNFYILDRLKELIKVKGYQVSPAELEEVIRGYPNVKDAAVIGIPHKLYGEVPRAYVTVKTSSKWIVEKIEDYVADKVASYKQIKGGIVIVHQLPKSPSGKCLRKELKLQYSKELPS